MLNRTSLYIIIVTFLSLIVASSASAYSFTDDFNKGIYWQTLPIPLTVVGANDTQGALLYDAVSDAADQWENAAGQDIWSISGDYVIGNPGGNVIRWSTNFAAETGYDASSTLAVAVRYQQGPYYARTEIIINENLASINPYGISALHRVILHEMGHTIGLDHSNQNAIMAPYIGNLTTLQNDDANGVIELINQTHYRQSIGYVSPYSMESSTESSAVGPLSCGTVDMGGGSGGSSGSGGGNAAGVILSLLLGVLLVNPKSAFKLKLSSISN